MSQKQVSIEIGGFCARIRAQNPVIFRTVMQQFGGFTSTRKPHFIIEFTGQPTTHDGRVNLNAMRIVRDGATFIIRAGLSLHNQAHPHTIDIGSIDMKKKKCLISSTGKALICPTILSCFQIFLLNANGFILHASAVVKENKAFVFTGPSGSGKSTVAGRKHGGIVLADDLICIRKFGNHFMAYGTPWHNKHSQRPANIKGIFFLEHARATEFDDIASGSAAHELMANISMNVDDRAIQERLLRTLSKLVAKRFCRWMRFSLRDPFWKLLEEKYLER